LRKEQSDFITPWQEVNQEHANDVRYEVDKANIGAAVWYSGGESYASPDGHNLNDTIDTTKQCCLQRRKPKRGNDDLTLVRQ